MRKFKRMMTLGLAALLMVMSSEAMAKKKDKADAPAARETQLFKGLKWRSIGPAFASGRIADFAVNPDDFSEYYVAVASGHLWKTTNNGITFEPVFDNHGVYSTGCVTLDPSNPHVVWLGTGENNHQRALGYGNGVWKSNDGGKSWENMGLKESRQIGDIIIDPRNGDVVYVAAEGSAWGPGGDRGLYKTTDGGKTWEKVLEISENTGVANVCFEPGNPDVLYAGAEQRRRRQFGKIGGGPESAFYKSTDAGKTWNKLTNGIPGVDKGGMAIAVSPVDPEIVYVMFEATDQGGVYRSTDRGASFSKMSDYNSSGQYYSELYCDPVDADKIYSVDTYSRYSEDGGKNWNNLSTNQRHVDDHALWIDPKNTDHFFIGGDGGVYESWDGGQTYLFKTTLPVTQFYRVNVDNTEPFYWVYGGTQDNNSMGGPSRNTNRGGVTSSEWVVTLGGDGFWQAIDPVNPDIVYSAYQYGNIYRYDRSSGERHKVQPTPRQDEDTYRWNWDAPFILSSHDPATLYMAANKVFKSTDRGNTWTVISEDITRNEDRNQFPLMGKYWPADAVAKDVSTSQWGTALILAESPLKEGLIFVGTDDGVISISTDDGQSWRSTETFPGVPEYTMVSDIFPSPVDEQVVFASFNNIKSDDFKPYLLMSRDQGMTWTSVTGDLPEDQSVWTVLQDAVNPDLLIAGTELGIYASLDEGKHWSKLGNGMPDVAVRDMVVQERDQDLVVATFGRGFYILDDISPLRELHAGDLEGKQAVLFPVQDALMYIQEGSRYGTGSAFYRADNPAFGATFTWYLDSVPPTLKSQRLKEEKALFKEGKPIPQPDRDQLKAEEQEQRPYVTFVIRDAQGHMVRTIREKASQGLHRTEWDLRYGSPAPVRLRKDSYDPTRESGSWMPALPGVYTVTMEMTNGDQTDILAGPETFETVVLENRSLPDPDPAATVAFYTEVADLYRVYAAAGALREELEKRTAYVRQALQQTEGASDADKTMARNIALALDEMKFTFEGTPAKASWEEVPPEAMPLDNRFENIAWVAWQSTGAPTQTQRENYRILMESLPPVLAELKKLNGELDGLDVTLDKLKAAHTPGRIPGF